MAVRALPSCLVATHALVREPRRLLIAAWLSIAMHTAISRGYEAPPSDQLFSEDFSTVQRDGHCGQCLSSGLSYCVDAGGAGYRVEFRSISTFSAGHLRHFHMARAHLH